MVCGSCSSQKAPLQFDEDRLHRVCDACRIILSKPHDDAEVDEDDDFYGVIDKLRADRTKTKSILKVNNVTCYVSIVFAVKYINLGIIYLNNCIPRVSASGSRYGLEPDFQQ